MKLLKPILLAGAATTLVALAPTVNAADYDPPIFVEEAPEYVPVEVGSGWYLRGDIGYAVSTSSPGSFDYRTFNAITGTYGQSTFATGSVDTSFSYGGGIGYRFNEWFRAEGVIEGFQGKFEGTTVAPVPCVDPVANPAYAGTTCRSEDSARYNGMSLMANGYVDLGTYAGFTPYAGAGVGYTYLRWADLDNDTYCVDGAAACPPPQAYLSSTTHPGEKSWRFTYALMAGMAYDISDVLKLDVGYRYSKIEGGPMFGFDAATATAGAAGVQGTDDGLETHEIRVGVRYELW
ncbi:MAG: porin family protein [Nitratireductor sp.]|jgi:opacity protein-like surface antigen